MNKSFYVNKKEELNLKTLNFSANYLLSGRFEARALPNDIPAAWEGGGYFEF